MDTPSKGGQSTIRGIVYQLLWSLLQVAEIQVLSTDIDPDGLSGSQATVLLEPVGGGGDIQVSKPTGRFIQQLKSGKHSWSLQNIITEVFPDLYAAVDLDRPDSIYQLITEGWMGDWEEVNVFFKSLLQKPCPEINILDGFTTRHFCPLPRRE